MTLPANVRVNVALPFPSQVLGSGLVAVTKQNGVWTIGLNIDALAVQSPPVLSLPFDYIPFYDSVAKLWAKIPLNALPIAVGSPVIGGQSTAASHGILFNKNGILGDSANDALGGPLVINNTGFPLKPFVNTEIPALVLSGAVDNATTNETILHFDAYGANSNGTILFSKSGGGSSNTGSIAGSVLTVTAQSYGSIAVNQIVMAPGLTAGTTVTSFGTGAGGTGTYNLSSSATVAGPVTILTDDSPLFPTATKDQQGMGFIGTSGWYGNPGVRAFASAFLKFRADGDFTASSWPTAIDLRVNPAGSTVNNVTGLSIGSNAVVTIPSVVLAANIAGDGLVLSSPTAAAAGNQQYSPGIRLSGSGWKTNAVAGPQPVDWRIYNQPVQGVANPSTTLFFDAQINGGGYVSQARLTSGGILNVAVGYQIGGAPLAFSNLAGTISTAQQGGNAGGDLTGTYPNPTIASITSGAFMPGFIDATGIAAPAAPAAGKGRIFIANNATNNLKVGTSAGGASMTSVPIAVVASQFLTGMDNTGTFTQAQPSFANLSGAATRAQGASDMVLLNTLTASNSATLDDTASLSASYDLYFIEFENVVPVTNAVKLQMRVTQNAGGAWLATGYLDVSASIDAIYIGGGGTVDNTAGIGISGFTYFHGPNGTSNVKIARGQASFPTTGAASGGNIIGWYNGNNAAINGFRFLMSSGNISTGKIRIYGIKTA